MAALRLYRSAAPSVDPTALSKGAQARSYRALRQTVGWIGLILPWILMTGNALIFGGVAFIHSLSRFYHTDMRNVFVGGLCAMALFLFQSRGPDRRQRWAGYVAGTCALGVAFCPVAPAGESIGPTAAVHYVCAAGLFLTLAMMSLVLFGQPGGADERRDRNYLVVHRICGLVVIASILMNIHHAAAADCDKTRCTFVLWSETPALTAFGISWLLEGRSLRPAAGETEVRAA